MYKYNVNKRAPVASFILDDTIPFQENSGSGVSGTKKTGTSDPTTSVPLVNGAAFSSVFKSTSVGQFACNLFKQGLENRPFVLEAWILPIPKTSTGPQQILSHDGIFDGLSINGKVVKFSTQYATYGEAACTHDLGEYKLAHVVGIHTLEKNELYVNGAKVAEIHLTEDQKGDTYVVTDNFLYSGYTTSTQELAVNAVAFYPSLSGDQIMQNYLNGTETIGQANVYPQYDGMSFNMNTARNSVFLTEQWVDSSDFFRGKKTNVEIGPNAVVPAYVSDVSVAGNWMTGVPLDGGNDTSIYGVLLSWTGEGITVDVSLDGTAWTSAVNGELISIIPNGYNPTDKDLWIRVSFAGGLASDPAFLESLTVIGYRTNEVDNSSDREVTVTYPAVLRDNYEPNLYRDDNGIHLHGGTMTIGTDSSADPDIARTLEVWIKTVSGTPTISVGGTKYRNGAPDTTLPVGEWSLIHYVAAADINTTITISGNCIVGQVTLYPTALSASDVSHIWKSYTGSTAIRFEDPVDIEVTDGASPVNIYAHDWAIDQAG